MKRQTLNNQLLDAAQNGQTDTVIALLERGADIKAKNNAGLTASECARNEQHQHICDLLNNWADRQALSMLIQAESRQLEKELHL